MTVVAVVNAGRCNSIPHGHRTTEHASSVAVTWAVACRLSDLIHDATIPTHSVVKSKYAEALFRRAVTAARLPERPSTPTYAAMPR